MKRLLLYLLSLLLLIPVLSACRTEEDSIIGTWVQDGGDHTYIFRDDGSGRHHHGLQRVEITYETKGETITVYDKMLWMIEDVEIFYYELDGDILRLTDGETTRVFRRQPSTEA